MNMLLSAVGVSLIFGIFMLLVPIALLVVLQVWLCKKSLKLGLILPVLSFLLSLLMVLSLGTIQTVSTGGSYLVTEDGTTAGSTQVMVAAEDGTYIEVPAQEGGHHQEEHHVGLTPGAVGALVGLFLVGNIPTVVFGGIWLHYKNRRDFQDDLKKMKIEDLE